MKQKLIIMVGLPGSGKSTKAIQIAEDNDLSYISRDFVRNMIGLDFSKRERAVTRAVFLGLVEAALLRKESVVADATHLTVGSRAPLIELGKKYGAEIISLTMNTSYETCILRNSKRDDCFVVPVKTIRSMANVFNAPKKFEGFTSVYTYNEGEDDKWN